TIIQTIPALLLSAVDREDPVRVGDQVHYTITVQNQGSGDDSDVNVKAIVPDEQEFVSANGVTRGNVDGRTITFETIPTLGAGKSVQWEVTTKALRPADTIFRVEATSKSITKPATKEEPTKLY
ncbi:MAG TPA: hypothetical protein VLI90_07815, partial [Tepidisphaeraceae bacterium]|nr:hypothetical protein [Tepidisphaeraceae bacterium]